MTNQQFTVPAPIQENPSLFWSKVDQSEECWAWMGGQTNGGYGIVNVSGSNQQLRAHRVSYALNHGSFLASLFICHHCDNPVCVRPDHLFAGTPRDNSRDMMQKGRHASFPGRPTKKPRKAKPTGTDLASDKRRELTLRALRGESPKKLSDEYGVHRTLIYYYIRTARQNVSKELPFWEEVDEIERSGRD